MINIQFLGTSAGLPTKTRNVSAIAVKPSSHKTWTLIDCGEATQHQLLHTALSPNQLEMICITHVHGDHCYGLPGLLASMVMHQRTAPLNIIAPDGIRQLINAHFKYSALQLTYDLAFHATETLSSGLSGNHFHIERCPLSHRVPSYAYKLTYTQRQRKLDVKKLQVDQIPKGPLWGQLMHHDEIISDNGQTIKSHKYIIVESQTRKVVICGDNDQPECLDGFVEDCDVLVHEATYTQAIADKVGNIPMHSSAKAIAQYAERKNIAKLILTHFSSRYQSGDNATPNINEIASEAARFYNGSLHLAHDFAQFEID